MRTKEELLQRYDEVLGRLEGKERLTWTEAVVTLGPVLGTMFLEIAIDIRDILNNIFYELNRMGRD